MSPSKSVDISFDTFYNIVDGKQRTSKNVHNGVNPATSEKLWDVPIASQQDVDEAAEAAKKAFVSWSQTPIQKRKELMLAFRDLYEGYQKEFTDLMCKETGKPRNFAGSEVAGVMEFLKFHAELDIPVDRYENDTEVVETTWEPLGVVGAICPWNFPLILSTGKLAPALLSGCTIIIKPSPFTPYTALKLVELAQQIFPPGVVQVLGGDDKLGPMLTAHPDIAKISFTGSIATGKKIMEACSKTLKRVTLELGGNDPCIVMPDVDMAKAIPEVSLK